ncbi:hypothetical protein SAMN05216421_1095 [Halopseudomonas xinjiangensis]|uniref:DUF1064 domain-containing protein n=1 Tax=Halopseudomonas xinjiangensis TaxID=487184 RepID=A0A1H1QCF3_9GAMM|nr:DUF1064 domain-containing protein [Halopseudomonas xinjiangensis]SDS20559.1 hypothetical protein SAMN05216421_1095 [Halopseudomonas xinjiangensis]
MVKRWASVPKSASKASAGKVAIQALGRLKQGQMNKTEQAYAAHLELLKACGEVLWYSFEGMKFRLADSTFYTPDFPGMLADGHIEIHEVKGVWTDDARVKIKVAAELFPFPFVAVKKAKTGWAYERFE